MSLCQVLSSARRLIDDGGGSSSDSDVYRSPPHQNQHHKARRSRAPVSPSTPSPPAAVRRSSRIRQDNILRRRSVQQEEALKKMMRRHVSAVAESKRRKQQHDIALTASSSIPSTSSSSSQCWCGVMRQILTTSLGPQDASSQNEPVVDDLNPAEVAPMAIMPAVNKPLAQSERAASCDKHDNVYGGAARCMATIAMIATRARCQDALRVLQYLEKLREEKNGTSAGYDWLEDHRRCSAVFELLSSIPAIKSLDSVFRRKLLPQLELVTCRKGDVIFREDLQQEMVWLILNGRVGLSAKDKQGIAHQAAELNEGQVMGNLLPERRLATATCLEQCALLRVDGLLFRQTLEDPKAKSAVAKKDFFKSVSLFQGLGDMDLDRLTSAFRMTTLQPGDVLCREGHRADHLYLIKRGRCRLLKAFVPKQEEGVDDGNKLLTRTLPVPEYHSSAYTKATPPAQGRMAKNAHCTTSRGCEVVQGELTRLPEENKLSTTVVTTQLSLLRHFDVGTLGRRDFLGEGGFTAAACAGAGAGTGEADGAAGAHYPSFLGDTRPGGNYLVSAVADRGADVYAANVSDLVHMQSAAMKRCWVEGRSYHRMREREWNPEALGARMERQVLWEHQKRAIVLDCVRTDVLEKKMATGPGSKGRGDRLVVVLPDV